MKSKDQQLLEEAYLMILKENKPQPSFFEDALVHPEKYELQLDTIETEDWDGNAVYNTIAYLFLAGIKGTDYERIDNPGDINNLWDAFEQKNPEGILDHRTDY